MPRAWAWAGGITAPAVMAWRPPGAHAREFLPRCSACRDGPREDGRGGDARTGARAAREAAEREAAERGRAEATLGERELELEEQLGRLLLQDGTGGGGDGTGTGTGTGNGGGGGGGGARRLSERAETV